MAYTKNSWETGDIITAAKLNHMEDGIAASDLSESVKTALLQIAAKVAYIDDQGQEYYDALEEALYPDKTLTGIGAAYDQSGSVYPSTSLDSLKSDLTVTAYYDDGSTAAVTTYTLSGTLTVGTSTITATYSGFTDTFEVTVSEPATVTSIAAVYTQSGTVYDTDSLDSLKSDLVVTATYSDSSTATVPSADYTLSGTLTVGTSTITVSYEGKTTSFSVTVSGRSLPTGYTQYDYVARTASGSSLGIKTDIAMSTDYTLETELKYTDSTQTNAICVMGSRSGSSGTKEFALWITSSTGKLGYWINSTDTTKTANPFTVDTLHSVKYLPVGKGSTYPAQNVIVVDGTEYQTGNTDTGSTFHAWLALHNYGISATALNSGYFNNFGLHLGAVTIKDSTNTIIHELVPCSDGTNIGYYDFTTEQLYLATDSTKFSVGNWT